MKFSLIYIFLSLYAPLTLGKPHMVAEVGKVDCVEKIKLNSKKIESVGIIMEGANSEERQWVNDIAGTIENLTNQDQAIRLLSGLKIVFSDTLRMNSSGGCLPAHQLIPGEIHMARKCPNGQKIPVRLGILIHEMGHFVANKGGYYPKYNSAVSRKCKLSGYMSGNRAGRKHRNRNEEFAEVFASYLTYTKRLKRKCRKSYNFMKEQIFLGSKHFCR